MQEDPDRETGANESVPSCLHLRGKLNVGALEDALALLVLRHEVLHARYAIRHGEALQVSAQMFIPRQHVTPVHDILSILVPWSLPLHFNLPDAVVEPSSSPEFIVSAWAP